MTTINNNYQISCALHLEKKYHVQTSAMIQGIEDITSSIGWSQHNAMILSDFAKEKKVYLLLHNDKIKGFVNIHGLHRGSEKCHIHFLAVHSEYQKLGLGHSLMNRVFHKAQKYGIKNVSLGFRSNKPHLVKFYHSFPYETLSEKGNNFGNGDPRTNLTYDIQSRKI